MAECTVVRLRLTRPGTSAYFVLPATGANVRHSISRSGLFTPRKADWRVETLRLHLPRFEADMRVSMRGTLAALGIADLFDPAKQSLSEGFSGPGTFVHDLVQSARLKVDERGVSAASITTSIVVGQLPSTAAPDLVFDHPFCVAIVDERFGPPLGHFFSHIQELG